ncbi:hypothetical protein KCP75_06750 [Salmonella enterica subsp. enterica]|nr:hypothetical protein KCP75_06750 [Salmonella enterica subsp. enterica]
MGGACAIFYGRRPIRQWRSCTGVKCYPFCVVARSSASPEFVISIWGQFRRSAVFLLIWYGQSRPNMAGFTPRPVLYHKYRSGYGAVWPSGQRYSRITTRHAIYWSCRSLEHFHVR